MRPLAQKLIECLPSTTDSGSVTQKNRAYSTVFWQFQFDDQNADPLKKKRPPGPLRQYTGLILLRVYNVLYPLRTNAMGMVHVSTLKDVIGRQTLHTNVKHTMMLPER